MMFKISRNDPCHCGSGKKYKKCCLQKDEQAHIDNKAQQQAEANLNHFSETDEAELGQEMQQWWSAEGEVQLGHMDRVVFTQTSQDDTDIIIALSFEEDTTFGVEGFIIQRSPKFEVVLPVHERGARVLLDGFLDAVLVTEVYLDRESIKIVTTGHIAPFYFDLYKISDEEYQALVAYFGYLNFDHLMKLVCH